MNEDSFSFEVQSIKQRKKSCKQLKKVIQIKKLFELNTEIIGMLENELKAFYLKSEYRESQEIRKMFQNLHKNSQIQNYEQQINQINLSEQFLKQEIKNKLKILSDNQIPLPYILGFLKIKKNQKISLSSEDTLLDCLNFTLLKEKIKEQQNSIENKINKMTELLQKSLEIIELKKQLITQDLGEMIYELQKGKTIIKKLELYKGYSLDQQSQKSYQIIEKLLQEFIIEKSSLPPRKNGLRWLTKLLMLCCYTSQIFFPEIFIYIRIRAKQQNNQDNKAFPLQLAKKLDFLRKIYLIPSVKEQCDKENIIPLDQSKRVPHYLLTEYNLHLHMLCKDKFQDYLYLDNAKDVGIESQLMFLIDKFQQYKKEIIENFSDIRFQQNLEYIYAQYSFYMNNYNGRLESLKEFEIQKQGCEIITVSLIRHIELMIQSENMLHNNQNIIKFDFDENLQFQIDEQQKINATTFSKFFYIKIFISDLIAKDQPFPQLFEFIQNKQGKIDSINCEQKLCQLLDNEYARTIFKEKYNLHIISYRQRNICIFKYISLKFDDVTRDYQMISWEFIILYQLRIIFKYNSYLKKEIKNMCESYKFNDYKINLNQNNKYYQEQIEIIKKLNSIKEENS